MRSRLKTHIKALRFSLIGASALLFGIVFFYDGPLHLDEIGPAAHAKETELATLEQDNVAPQEDSDRFGAGILPNGFQAQWRQVALDNEQVRLKVLKSPLMLAQTKNRVGSEAFQYASYLFEQMASSIHNPEVAEQVKALSLQAQTMGNAVSQASAFEFAGPPTTNMDHLQVRSSIMYYLSSLNPNAVVQVKYNQHGEILEQAGALPSAAGQQGEALKAFLSQVETVLHHPGAKAYPQTMKLLKQESELLQNLASHLTLRWESTLDCHQDCGNVVVFLRVYAHQTLPEKTLAAVML